MLEIRGIKKVFGSTHAVKDVQLTIRDGEFFSLLGPSGCGKTTLLRMLGGFEEPSAGEIWLDGRRIDTLPANQRSFNMVFQRYALFPHLNVWENVAFGLKMKKVPAAEIKTRVAEMIAMVKMEGMESRAISTLSGGQQQRIALARALVNRPKVLLLDEPLSALDLKLRQQMQVELRSLQRRLGLIFIFVTHDQEEALTLSDRIAVMNGGVIEQVGTPAEIYEHPNTPFVAQFIGTINSWAARVEQVSQDRFDLVAGREQRLSALAGGGSPKFLNRGDRVRVMIRPEKLRIEKSASDMAAGRENFAQGTIKEIFFQGAFTQFVIDAPEWSDAPIVASRSNTGFESRSEFSVSDRVGLSWAPGDCLLMPEATA